MGASNVCVLPRAPSNLGAPLQPFQSTSRRSSTLLLWLSTSANNRPQTVCFSCKSLRCRWCGCQMQPWYITASMTALRSLRTREVAVAVSMPDGEFSQVS